MSGSIQRTVPLRSARASPSTTGWITASTDQEKAIMRTCLNTSGLVSAVLLPATLLTVLLVGIAFFEWHADVERRAAPIKHEIAQNFSEKWGRCDVAAKWDAS